MNDLTLAVDDLKAAQEKDSLLTLLIYTGIGAGAVALLMAFRKE